MKKNIIYPTISAMCFILCILIVELFRNNMFIRGFIGDIIVVLLIYFSIKTFHNFSSGKLTIFVLLLAFTTEFLQYLKLINLLGLEKNLIAQLTIGSVFDPADLLAYTIGAVTAYLIDIKIEK